MAAFAELAIPKGTTAAAVREQKPLRREPVAGKGSLPIVTFHLTEMVTAVELKPLPTRMTIGTVPEILFGN